MRLEDVKSNKKSKAHFTTSININNLTSDDMLKLINERQLTFSIAKYQKLYFLSTILSVFIVYKTSKEKGYLWPLKILFRHRIEVLREIALRLHELSVLPPFRANATVYMSSEHFQQ